MWAIEGERGDYVANVELGAPGDYKAVFITEAPGRAAGGDRRRLPGVRVLADDRHRRPAPATDNPTVDVRGRRRQGVHGHRPRPGVLRADGQGGARGEAAVRARVRDARRSARARQCGPTLDRIKAVAAESPDNVKFINVEPYQLTYTEGRLQPVLDANNQLQPVEAVNTWGILTEPWVFTVDASGVVRGSFEGVIGEDELKAAIQAISGSRRGEGDAACAGRPPAGRRPRRSPSARKNTTDPGRAREVLREVVGGNWVAFSSGPSTNRELLPVVGRGS